MSTSIPAAMTPAGMAQLRLDEGWRLQVYDDATGLPIRPGTFVKGHPTIGIGRALDVNGITSLEAQNLFFDDVGTIVGALSQYGWFQNLDPVRRDVIINMAFNMGIAGALAFTNMIAAIQRGELDRMVASLETQDWDTAADALLSSTAARDDAPRYQRLAAAMRSGSWSNG